jgi:hypothetical protein
MTLSCRTGRRQRRQLLEVEQPRPWLDRAAVIDKCGTARGLFDHVVCDREYAGRHLDAERARRFEVDGELKFSRL